MPEDSFSYLSEVPSFYDNVSDLVSESDFNLSPYDEISKLLFAQLKQGVVKPGSIINSFEDPDVQESVADVFSYSFSEGISESDVKKTINDCIIRILSNSIGYQLDVEQDLARIIELKKKQEGLQKLNVFGRKN